MLASIGVSPVIFPLNLNDAEFFISSFGLSLYYYHKAPDVFQ